MLFHYIPSKCDSLWKVRSIFTSSSVVIYVGSKIITVRLCHFQNLNRSLIHARKRKLAVSSRPMKVIIRRWLDINQDGRKLPTTDHFHVLLDENNFMSHLSIIEIVTRAQGFQRYISFGQSWWKRSLLDRCLLSKRYRYYIRFLIKMYFLLTLPELWV